MKFRFMSLLQNVSVHQIRPTQRTFTTSTTPKFPVNELPTSAVGFGWHDLLAIFRYSEVVWVRHHRNVGPYCFILSPEAPFVWNKLAHPYLLHETEDIPQFLFLYENIKARLFKIR